MVNYDVYKQGRPKGKAIKVQTSGLKKIIIQKDPIYIQKSLIYYEVRTRTRGTTQI
jgi:hypothetical protein